jgi:hypothetical protein
VMPAYMVAQGYRPFKIARRGWALRVGSLYSFAILRAALNKN